MLVECDETLSVEVCHSSVVLHVVGAQCDQNGDVGSMEIPFDALESIESALRAYRHGDI